MLILKNYQKNTLACLQEFLEGCRVKSIVEAYQEALTQQDRTQESYSNIFPNVPTICLRIPTGGGKTLLASHAIATISNSYLDTDAPVVLWLTPSDTIRSQTLEALSKIDHPYRQALTQHFGDKVKVCELENLQTINSSDTNSSCIIVVATIQAFNVDKTTNRNVYAFFEELAPHFDNLLPNQKEKLEKVTEEDIQVQSYLTQQDIGRVKFSVANWLNLHNPIIIIDEAHNNRTDRFFTTLNRINPSCIVELTATPVKGNNVLYHVSALELKAEQMIKLPIVLSEHPQGWQECVRDTIITLNKLNAIAQNETEYIRPIALIQATPKGGDATVDVVKQYLMEQENIPEQEIAIATGSQKELDNVDLFDPQCPIRYVITVEALKEGWDCSFAYILSSLQSVNSAKDVEQLLGRVLRMPYAKNRKDDNLNKAYAHIVAENFAQAASSLKDRMVQNMGFDPLEAATILTPKQSALSLEHGSINSQTTASLINQIPACSIQLSKTPDTTNWPEELKQKIRLLPNSQGATLQIEHTESSETLQQAESFVIAQLPPKEGVKVKEQFAEYRAVRQAYRAPAQLGINFVPIPQLCIELDGYVELVEKDTLANIIDWDLLNSPVQLTGFNIQETTNAFVIDINQQGRHLSYHLDTIQQLHLNEVTSHVSEQDLVRWLDSRLRRANIAQPKLQAYLVKMLSHLIRDRNFTLTALVRAQYQLEKAIDLEIDRTFKLATTKGFQQSLPNMLIPQEYDKLNYHFHFQTGSYPAKNMYKGSFEFQKHFYPVIHDLKEKTATGAQTEEFTCAMAIDSHPQVKHWVRNIERQPQYSFWLPTATDYFYPDFVAELDDGRILVVEYKGEPYKTNDDSREKMQVGYQWEKASNGLCLFLFAVKQDSSGRDVFRQIEDKINK